MAEAKQLASTGSKPANTTFDVSPGTALRKIIDEGHMTRRPEQPQSVQSAAAMVTVFAAEVRDERIKAPLADVTNAVKLRIQQIDEAVSAQLDEILHHPQFQQLEASWRGLHKLVHDSETGTRLKIRLLSASRDELEKDMLKAAEFDQSRLFKLVYEEEYGTFGGAPFSCLVFDLEFGRSDPDVALLTHISQVAAAAHAPAIAAASPHLFDLEDFREIGAPRDLKKAFESSELAKWKSYRDSEDSRYVALVLPRVLTRMPYGKDNPVDGFEFTEQVEGTEHARYAWGNAAYALAGRITSAFAKYGWTAAIRGVEGGGVVAGLPLHKYKTVAGADGAKVPVEVKCPTEVAITDRRENELNELGFIALCHRKGEDYAVFFGGSTTNKPQAYDTDSANANARISAALPYLLNASRFAHYLKAMMRDKIGSFQSRGEVEAFLNRWIGRYVLGMDNASQDTKAQHPLREARVDVREVPGRPGAYIATVFLRPHFQLEELTASVRLVAELPAPAA